MRSLLLSGAAATCPVQLQFMTTPLSSSIHSLSPLSATAMLFVPCLLRPSPATPPDKAQDQQQDPLLQAQGHLCPFHSSSGAAGCAGCVPGAHRAACPCEWPVFVTEAHLHPPLSKAAAALPAWRLRTRGCCSCLHSSQPQTSLGASGKELLGNLSSNLQYTQGSKLPLHLF